MEQEKDNTVAIVERFFKAIRTLIDGGVLRGLQTFTRRYNLNRRNIQRLEREPYSGIFHAGWLTYLVEDYKISSLWLLTGRGAVFADGWDADTVKKVQMTGNSQTAPRKVVDVQQVTA
jgi:hypothetical protein